MNNPSLLIFACSIFWLAACRSSTESTFPQRENISESVYASGLIKAAGQYQAFVNASGTVQDLFVKEGDTVAVGTPILSLYNESTRINRELAEVGREYADRRANQSKLRDLERAIDLAKNKLLNDSLLYARQQSLRSQGIGSAVELEQRKLNFENARTSYQNSVFRYQDLKREIDFNERNASKNLAISKALESELVLKSEMDGIVYSLLKEKGEMVTPQMALAVIGSADDFLLELKVDEYDIVKVRQGQAILVTMDSYRGQVFQAVVSRIYPIMDEKTKSFTVEGVFKNPPPRLYPNLSLEANIVIQSKGGALTIPRAYLLKDSSVVTLAGDTVLLKLGLMDYEKVEVLEGLDEKTEIIKPKL